MLKHAAFTLALITQPLQATANCLTDAMIVFDGSGSMSEVTPEFRTPRIVEAREAIARAMPQVTASRRLGLLIFGPGARDGCSNIDLRFAPQPDAAADIIADVAQLRPGGMTPLAASVEEAATILQYRTTPATIVVVTDGNETCGGTPCRLAERLHKTAQDLTIHVIGFKVRVDFFSWDNPEQTEYSSDNTVAKCLPDQTGGTYSATETTEELVDALNDTLGCALIGRAGSVRKRI